MTRALFNDKLMSFQYHLLDVDFSMSVPPWVLLPSAGFSSISAPEIAIETETIEEGVDPFIHHTLKKASTNTLTLQKGVSAFNSDFWRWTMACLRGDNGWSPGLIPTGPPKIPGKRRTMLLMHYTGISPEGLGAALSEASGPVEKIRAGLLGAAGGGAAAAAQTIKVLTGGLIDLGITSVPGKVYMLIDCLPTRYKPASDFDAASSEVSLEELDIVFHRMEEMSLSA